MNTLWNTPAPRYETWPPRACEGADTALFFSHGNGTSAREQRAKAICQTCEALAVCADYAIPLSPLVGIWGGMSHNERARERTKHKKEAS